MKNHTASRKSVDSEAMEIDGHTARVNFDPGLGMYRGEFIGLNGGADFYAMTMEGLRTEGMASLRLFLVLCAENGFEPNAK